MIQCEPSRSIDAVLREIHSMDRERCIHELTHFEQMPLDFDRAFLSGMSVEQLRHVLTAAVRTVHRRQAVTDRTAVPRPLPRGGRVPTDTSQ